MSDPARIYENLPDCYDRKEQRDTYKLLSGLATAIAAGDAAVSDFVSDLTVQSADGEGLIRRGEDYAVPRPMVLTEPGYAILIRTKLPCKRGTIQAIRSVFEAATGLTNVVVRDWHTHSVLGIPPYEIWIYVPSQSYLYGAYAEPYTTPAAVKTGYVAPWPPEDSCYASLVYNGYGAAGGEYNDHWWSAVDAVTESIIDSVKLAGTIVIYKYA